MQTLRKQNEGGWTGFRLFHPAPQSNDSSSMTRRVAADGTSESEFGTTARADAASPLLELCLDKSEVVQPRRADVRRRRQTVNE